MTPDKLHVEAETAEVTLDIYTGPLTAVRAFLTEQSIEQIVQAVSVALLDRLAALEAERAAGEARVVEWQPVTTAPPACHVLAARFNAVHGEWIYSVKFSSLIYPFTHWQPLPASPALVKQGPGS